MDIATNVGGKMYPGAGSQAASIIAATGLRQGKSFRSNSIEEPGTYDLMGKPNPFIFDLICEQHGLDPSACRAVMIGDNPSTDILFGKAAGIDTCMVLSGVVKGMDDFKTNWLPKNPDYDPTFVMQMVGDLSQQ